jgi:hypothetical protein
VPFVTLQEGVRIIVADAAAWMQDTTAYVKVSYNLWMLTVFAVSLVFLGFSSSLVCACAAAKAVCPLPAGDALRSMLNLI